MYFNQLSSVRDLLVPINVWTLRTYSVFRQLQHGVENTWRGGYFRSQAGATVEVPLLNLSEYASFQVLSSASYDFLGDSDSEVSTPTRILLEPLEVDMPNK